MAARSSARARFRQQILDRSRMFVGSTPLPLPLANAALAGVRILKANQSLRAKLMRQCGVRENGLARGRPAAARNARADRAPAAAAAQVRPRRLNRALLAAGIYPPFIKYPGGPPNGYFRFVISSEHTRPQLDGLIKVLRPYAQSRAKAQ